MKISYSIAKVHVAPEHKLTATLNFVNVEDGVGPAVFASENDAAAFIQDKLVPGPYTIVKIYSKE